MAGAEHRRHERYAASLTVQVERDGVRRFGTIYELSLGGAFLELTPAPPVGAILVVVITVDGRELGLPAEVRYFSYDGGPRGMEGVGIQWTDLPDEARDLVATLVDRAQTGKSLRGE